MIPSNPRSAWLCAAMGYAIAAVVASAPDPARATPSTTFWAPSTPYVQPFGVLHVTYDTYFGTRSAYPIDTGLTVGLLASKKLQAEAGFDLFYPTVAADGPVKAPLVLNGKIGAPEDTYFKGQPAWSVGIFGVGLKRHVNDQNALYGMLGRTISHAGTAAIGGYYGLNRDMFRSAAGDEQRLGLIAGWASSSFDVPFIDRAVLAWDVQTGKNALGATGGGAYLYITPAIDLLTGPVFFFEKDLQPGGSSWMWTMQLDVDLDLFAKHAH